MSFSLRHRAALVAVAAAAMLAAGAPALLAPAGARAAGDYLPGRLVVGYTGRPPAGLIADVARRTGAQPQDSVQGEVQLLALPRGETVAGAAARLRRLPGVAFAVPDYVAHVTRAFIPNDVGRGRRPTDWRFAQWNFVGRYGVHAPVAWAHLIGDQAPGGRGVTVAILDTGVAYRNWTDPRTGVRYARSPDFAGTRFRAPCDLIRGGFVGEKPGGPQATITARTRCRFPNALDRNGHGTFVAGVVGEATNNRIGVTGLAYGATLMPVRVLDANGDGDAVTIARGIRYAAAHGARVINLSLEFELTVGASDIPEVISAITFARNHGAVVVAAAGNDTTAQIAYPARDSAVVSVGATTRDGCLAAYSNTGTGLTLVAPGGGDDAFVRGDSHCHPGRALPDIYQMTLLDPSDPTQFGLPDGWYGTSMSSPHVAAVAAMIMASGVLGARPTVAQVIARIEQTATPLGAGPRPNPTYGYGLLDAGAATAGRSLTVHHRGRHKKHGVRR